MHWVCEMEQIVLTTWDDSKSPKRMEGFDWLRANHDLQGDFILTKVSDILLH